MNHKKIPAMLPEIERLGMVSVVIPFDTAKAGFNIMEIWKDIENYEGVYQVSNYGRIKSFAQKSLGKIKIPHILNKGYLRIGLDKNANEVLYLVHRLVAMAFIPNPFKKPQINHKNSNKQDNKVQNLEWCTNGENLKHSYSMGIHCQDGMKNNNVKLNELQVRVIRKCKDIDNVKLGKIFNVNNTTIGRIKRKTTWISI